MGQGRVARGLHKLHSTAAPCLLRHTHQALPLPQRVLKDLGGRPVPQQCDGNALRLGERRKEDPLLRFVKIGESVKIYILAPQIGRLGQRIPELLHPGAGIPSAGPKAGVVGGIQQRHVPQLVPLLPRGLLHPGIELLGRDLVGVQLVHQRHQLLQKSRPAGGIIEHPQAAAHLLQRHAHGEKLAPAIQGEVRQAAHLTQHPAGQVAQAQHLRIAAGRVPQGMAERHLRLMGHMLRHDQDLAAPGTIFLHSLQDPGRLSGAGPADPQMQHGLTPPPVCLRYTDYIIGLSLVQIAPTAIFIPRNPAKHLTSGRKIHIISKL